MKPDDEPKLQQPRWSALLERVCAGDEDALRKLYEATSARVFGLACRVLGDRSQAEDVVVDVYAQVWRQAAHYDARKGSVATWIYTLARTRAIDLRRARTRRRGRETPLDALQQSGSRSGDRHQDALEDPGISPLRAAEHSDRADSLRAALQRLPHEQRRALEAAFFGGLSHTEISSSFELPLGTIKTRIRTGLAALRTALAAREGDMA